MGWVRRAAGLLVVVTAFELVAAAALYSILGVDRTLDLVARVFSFTYPTVGGQVAFPLVEWDRTLFHAHTLVTYGHVIFAPLALALGPLQLWPRLRSSRPRLHRALGIAYVVAQLIGLPCGMTLARWEYGGLTATFGFFFMGATTLVCTGLGVRAIWGADRAAHREWMIRGYVVMWSGSVVFRYVLLFLLPHLAERPLPDGFREPYVACVFLSWALGLLAADIYLTATKGRRSSVQTS